MTFIEFLNGRDSAPVRCAHCGYDAHGDLQVIDRWSHESIPGPRGANPEGWCAVYDVTEPHPLTECPRCDEDFSDASGVEDASA